MTLFFYALLFAFLVKLRVVARIAFHAAVLQRQDRRTDLIQKITVMGNDQKRTRICLQKAFQPFYALDVQVVGWFVQKQEIRAREQQFAHLHFALLAARKRFHWQRQIAL